MTKFNPLKLNRRNIAIWYIVAVPLFAFIYTKIPNGFIHSTVQYEQNTKNEVEIIKDSIASAVRQNFIAQHGTPIIYNEHEIANIKEFVITDLEIQNNAIVGIGMIFTKPTKGAPVQPINAFKFKMPSGELYRNKYISKIVEYDPNGMSDLFNKYKIFRQEKSKLRNDKLHYTLRVSHNLNNRIANLLASYNGDPSHLRGNYIRMLYLSATTITTLGLGDILPISNLARILVTIQSILGVILIGLYINTIVVDTKKKKKSA